MSEKWKEVKLIDVTSKIGDGLHGTPNYKKDGEYYFINGNNLLNGKITIKTNTKRVDRTQFNKYKKELNKNTLLVSINGTIGNVAFYNSEKIVLGKSACYINIKSADKYFIKHLLTSKVFQNYINHNYTGSVIKNVSLQSIRQFSFKLPPLPEQRAIASILSNLDDKIENNLAMNKTLEEMAMALYKHWFVDFGPFQDGKFVESELGMIPDGWEVNNLESLIEIKYGKDHKKLEEGNIPVYGTGGIMRYVNKSLYEEDSILIPRKGSLGNVYYISEPFWTVDTLFYTKIRNESYRKYLYYFIKNLDLASMDVGSAVPSLTTSLLKRIKVLVPPKEIVNQFEERITEYFNFKDHNLKENQILKERRDALLPKLMSGEVRVKGFG